MPRANCITNNHINTHEHTHTHTLCEDFGLTTRHQGDDQLERFRPELLVRVILLVCACVCAYL